MPFNSFPAGPNARTLDERLEDLRPQVAPRYWFDLAALPPILVPWLLRRPRLLSLAKAWLKPAAELYEQLLNFTLYARRELSYNGQTMMLEKALNDRFDPTLRRIRIINAQDNSFPLYLNFKRENQDPDYIYHESEGKPPRYLYTWAEVLSQVGFTVRAPRALALRELELNTRIRQLKIALVKYRIIYF